MQIAILGMGKMGVRLAEKLFTSGHEVMAWNRSKEVLDQLRIDKGEFIVQQKLKFAYSIEELRQAVLKPRVFWLMLPAGAPTDDMLEQVMNIADAGDIIVDGGNAYYKDTQRRYDAITKRNIKYLGIGVSGGVEGLENGFCLMAGGDQEGFEYLKPVFDSLCQPSGGYGYFGTGGAGHFIKMVHNGIEYGIMQALGEGFGVMTKSPYQLDLLAIAEVWQAGSIVRSFLLDKAAGALAKDPSLSQIEGVIAATGEAKWTVQQGKEEHVPVDIIEKSLQFRERSQYDKAVSESFAAKMVAALRKEFGGHDVKAVGEKEESAS